MKKEFNCVFKQTGTHKQLYIITNYGDLPVTVRMLLSMGNIEANVPFKIIIEKEEKK